MKDYIEERVRLITQYVINTGATVRDTARLFCVSKSTVHKDLTERIAELDPSLRDKVKLVLDNNLSERHIRGGIATRLKYKRIK